MSINDLPVELLNNIFRHSFKHSSINMVDWKSNELPLLWVCRHWRHVAISSVFSRVFIDWPPYIELSIFQQSFRTNLKTATRRNWIIDEFTIKYVRRIVMIVDNLYKPETSVYAFREVLGAYEWSSVNSLCIAGRSLDGPTVFSMDDGDAHLIAQFAVWLAGLAPKIRTVSIYNASQWQWQARLGQQLTMVQGGGITNLQLMLKHNITTSNSGRSVHLHFTYEEFFSILARCAATLQVLRVFRIPYTIDWRKLTKYTGTNQLAFDHLKKLHVSFRARSLPARIAHANVSPNALSEDTTYPQFTFPVIYEAIFDHMPAINPFILNKENFRTARSIAYKNGVSSIYELSTLDMASVEHLEVHLCQKSLYRKSRRYMSNYTKSSGVKPFYQATKRLFGGHPKRKVALRLDSFKPLDLEHVEWSNMAILDLAEPSLDVLFALALKLPNLSRLVSRFMSLDIYSLDRAAVVVRGVETQNKKLRSVCLFEPRPAPEEMLSRAVDQLLEAFQLHSVEFLSIFDEFINIANTVFAWKSMLYAETEFRAGKTE